MTHQPKLVELTEPQRRAIFHLPPEPQRATRGGPWSPLAAFNLVKWGYVKLWRQAQEARAALSASNEGEE